MWTVGALVTTLSYVRPVTRMYSSLPKYHAVIRDYNLVHSYATMLSHLHFTWSIGLPERPIPRR